MLCLDEAIDQLAMANSELVWVFVEKGGRMFMS